MSACAAFAPLPTVAPAPTLKSRKGHFDVVEANIGWQLDPQDWSERQASSKLLVDLTERIFKALYRGGVDLSAPSEVTAISAVTGVAEKLVAYKACRFLPSVAARDRRPLLNALRLFIEEHAAARFFRYIVVTRGVVLPLGSELRKEIKDFHRKLSKWAAWSREQGVEVLYRGTEFTRKTAEKRSMTDRYPAEMPLYNLHANLMTWPTRRLPEKEWSEYLKKSWEMLGAHWRDNGKVADPNELVKYCFKPDELQDAADDELVWLYEQTRRLKFAQPLGAFADYVAEIEEAHEKVVRCRVGGRGVLMRIRKASRLDHSQRAPREEAGGNPQNLILGITLPQWKHTPWAEPMILVQRYEPRACGTAAMERLRDIEYERAMIKEMWDRSGAPDPAIALEIAEYWGSGKVAPLRPKGGSFKVHTCRPTVRRTGPTNGPPLSGGPSEIDLGRDPIIEGVLRAFPGAKSDQIDRSDGIDW